MANDIATLKGTGEGSVKKALQDAKDYTDAETTRAEGIETGLNTRLANIEKSLGDTSQDMGKRVAALETKVGNENSGLVKGVADNAKAIDGVKTAYQAADANLKAEIDAIQAIPLEGATNSIESLFKASQA